MKHTYAATALLIAIVSASHAIAESSYERDFKQLKQQRDKALATAAEPIDRRYKDSLEQLLRRATQSNDLAAAVTIKQELDKLGGTAVLPAAAQPNSKITFAGSVWAWTTKETLTVNSDGTATVERPDGKLTWQWESQPDGTFTLDKGRFLLIPDKRGKTAEVKQPKDGSAFTITLKKNGK